MCIETNEFGEKFINCTDKLQRIHVYILGLSVIGVRQLKLYNTIAKKKYFALILSFGIAGKSF